MKSIVSGLLAALVVFASALAAGPPNPMPGILLGGNTSLAVSGTTSSVLLPSSVTTYPYVALINDGSSEVFFNYGGSGVTAAVTNYPLPASWCTSFWLNGATYVAAITSTGTSTLRIVQANGPGCG